ncbi:MAG: hypothetical protein NC336_03820 [Clostridium sp.]|nr:hypothetical protein [Clostridium sp.]
MKKIKIITMFLLVFAGVIPATAQETFKRGLEQVSFIPKGQWITGVSVSYTQSDQDNYQFLVIEDISGDMYSFKVSPMLQYCFKENMSAGGRFSYERTQTTLDRASVILSTDDTYDIDNFNVVSQNYYGTALFRNYFSLGTQMRFGFFNEVQLQVGGGESKIINGVGDDLTGTFERNVSVNVGLSPGMMMFLNNYSAIEVNVGVLGFGYTHTKSTNEHIRVSRRDSKHANFKINLFSISFGVVFYL